MSESDTAPHPLVGGWRLRSWMTIAEDGTETSAMGDAAAGLLVYTADGTMMAMLSRADRPPIAGDDPTGGSQGERAAAFSTFIAYGGRYEVAGSVVVHHVEISLFPNWVGSEQRREWRLDQTGRYLTLTSPPIEFRGFPRVQRLRWERVSEAPSSS